MRPAALFNTIVIAGVGLIGGSIGLGIRQRFLAHRVIGLDLDPVALEAAKGMGAIDEERLSPGSWLEDVDLVILASPARTLIGSAMSLRPFLRPDVIVTDVGSIKAEVVKALHDLRFVGGHPMAGSERIGVQNAYAGLLENAVWVLTPDEHTDPQALARVRGFVDHLGARPLEVHPE
jgi:prephenate dehydrogenase